MRIVPTYSVSQKIRTVATIDRTIQAVGITLRPFPCKPGKAAQSWAADLTVDAADTWTAVSIARELLIPLLDRLALVTQSAFSMAAQSYLVRRLTDNQDGTFYMFCARARHPNGMPLWSAEQVADIDALAKAPVTALRSFREAAGASTAQGALAALIIAAEALAGAVSKARKCACGGTVVCPGCGKPAMSPFPDQARLETILGTTTYKGLYRGTHKGGAVRNKLLHGSAVSTEQILELLQDSYDHILAYLRQTYGLRSVRPIVNAPRSFTQWEYFAHFARLKDGSVPDIILLDEGWPAQSHVEWVDPPAIY